MNVIFDYIQLQSVIKNLQKEKKRGRKARTITNYM